MTAAGPEGRLPDVDADTEHRTGSPAVAITLGAGLVGLLLSLNDGGFAMSLFFSLVALAALPLALADRPGGRSVRWALLGAASGLLGLLLVLGPLLYGEQQRASRDEDPPRSTEGRQPTVRVQPSASPTPGP